jgi:hypothetical protein
VICQDVRPLLPELAERALREAGPVQAHLVACPTCSADLAELRAILTGLEGLRDDLVEAPEGFVARAVEHARAARWQLLARRVASDERVQQAALGGVAVGVATVGLIWWRRGRTRVAREAAATVGAEA